MASDKTRRAVCTAVAHILQEEREKRGLTLTAVAAAAGLSRQMISFVEQETRNPTLDTVLRICDAIGIDFEAVLKRANREARK
jgi:transcriptional regulator with XRE-family HTH domain